MINHEQAEKFYSVHKRVLDGTKDITASEYEAAILSASHIIQIANVRIKSLDVVVREEIENRDRWEERASKLACAVGEYFGEPVGEHSSANCPIINAHELLNQI